MSKAQRDAFVRPGRVKEIIAEYRGRCKVVGEYLALKELAIAFARAEYIAYPEPVGEPVKARDLKDVRGQANQIYEASHAVPSEPAPTTVDETVCSHGYLTRHCDICGPVEQRRE